VKLIVVIPEAEYQETRRLIRELVRLIMAALPSFVRVRGK
jgi:hypothetical protein